MGLQSKCEFLYAPNEMHIYEVRPRKDKRGFDLISDALPFGRLLEKSDQDAQADNKLFIGLKRPGLLPSTKR